MEKRQGKNGGTIFVWEKGQSGNPEGPKKGYKQSRTILKKLLALEITAKHPITGEEAAISVAEALHLRQIQIALRNGDIAAYREILDRIEGKPTQRTEVTGKGGGPIETEAKQWVIRRPAVPENEDNNGSATD